MRTRQECLQLADILLKSAEAAIQRQETEQNHRAAALAQMARAYVALGMAVDTNPLKFNEPEPS